MPQLLSAGLTDQGNVRGNNEDRFHIDDQRGIYIVVDGMGGQAAGEEAAEIAVKTLRARLERLTDSPELRVREAIALANNAIYEAAGGNPEWRGMACVLTVAVVEDGTATVGHVGDSRLYLIRGGRIEKVTNDHSPVGEREDAGELTEDAAMKHPRRNEVYRDVGSAAHTPDDPDFIEVRKVPVAPDTALLLCSDGLSDVLPSRRILQIVEENAGDCQAAVKKLVKEAVSDGKDNVSVVLVEGTQFTRPVATSPAAPAIASSLRDKRRTPAAAWLLLGALLGLAAATAFFHARQPVPSSGPKTIHVAATGAEFSSVQEAIQSAGEGDHILLAPGHYTDRILLRNGTRIMGDPAGGSSLTGGVFADGIRGASIQNLTLRDDQGITIRNSEVEIERICVTGVKTAGVVFEGNSGGILLASRITGNAGPGVVVRDTASPLIENNFISGNQKGVEFLSTGTLRLIGNGITGNGAEALWMPGAPDSAVLAQNAIDSGKRAVKVVRP